MRWCNVFGSIPTIIYATIIGRKGFNHHRTCCSSVVKNGWSLLLAPHSIAARVAKLNRIELYWLSGFTTFSPQYCWLISTKYLGTHTVMDYCSITILWSKIEIVHEDISYSKSSAIPLVLWKKNYANNKNYIFDWFKNLCEKWSAFNMALILKQGRLGGLEFMDVKYHFRNLWSKCIWIQKAKGIIALLG